MPRAARCAGGGSIKAEWRANALNDRGVRTARGGHWHVSNVRSLLLRSALL